MSNDHTVRSPIAVRPASLIAPDEASASGGSGSDSFPVIFGYNGTYVPRVHGLNLPIIRRDIPIQQDPDKLFEPVVGNGVVRIDYQAPANQLYVRFAMFDALTDGNDDLDMYVFYCPDNDDLSCTEIGNSGGPTSEEEFNVLFPGEGTYSIFVHGFEVDDSNGSVGTEFDFVVWPIGLVDDSGNMTVSAPNTVTAGSTVDVTVDWSGLIFDTTYLGAISHTTPEGLVGITVIKIEN